jgi:hypothetical protein
VHPPHQGWGLAGRPASAQIRSSARRAREWSITTVAEDSCRHDTGYRIPVTRSGGRSPSRAQEWLEA